MLHQSFGMMLLLFYVEILTQPQRVHCTTSYPSKRLSNLLDFKTNTYYYDCLLSVLLNTVKYI
ncbi:hypothetical protein HanPI659440_Chr05g0217731 [Helianthus annuus]|nr:hypothetical protein HanPI659440_Chr05g0217731 [Helianthus annuus]